MLAQAVTANDDDVCVYFTDQGARDFTATVTTCADAIETLHSQVTDLNAYLNPDGQTVTTTPPAPKSTPAHSHGTATAKAPSPPAHN